MRNKQYSLRSVKIGSSTTRSWSARLVLLLALMLASAVCAAPGAARDPQPDPEGSPPLLLREGSLVYQDPRLPSKLPTRYWKQFLPRNARTNDDWYGRLRDPRQNRLYQYRLQVHCLVEQEGDNGERRFVIHYNRPSDEPLARRVGSVLARLHWLVRDYLGRLPAPSENGGRHVDVWLDENGPAGGEELSGHLYLTGIDVARPPAEWVRELAHEYAHLTLPKVGPYSEPEKWANGYLGERLFLKWLLIDNNVTDLWDQPLNAAGYLTHQVVPFRTRSLEAGPAAPDADRMDGRGMEFFIGTILALEAAHGPTLLRSLLNHFATPRPQNLGSNLTLALDDMQFTPLPLEPGAFIPSSVRPTRSRPGPEGLTVERVAYWVYLTGGRWRIEVDGDLPADTTARVETQEMQAVKSRSTAAGRAWILPVSTRNGLWRRLEFAAPPGETLTARAIRMIRTGS